jgi:hypothetical protein
MKTGLVLLAALTASPDFSPTVSERLEERIEVARFGEWGAACFKDGRSCSIGNGDSPLFVAIGLVPSRPQPEAALALDWQHPFKKARVTIEGSSGYRKSLHITGMTFLTKRELDSIASNSTVRITFATAGKRETISIETGDLVDAFNHSLEHLRRTGNPHPWDPYRRAAK